VAFQSQVAESAGFFFPPTILTAVRPGMPAADEEIFGPVAAVMTVRDEAAAVRAANASDYGLGATVCTRDAEAADRVAEQLEVGCVFVNALVRSMPELPFGGVKQSGLGRELGHWGAQAFTNVKTIVGAARVRS